MDNPYIEPDRAWRFLDDAESVAAQVVTSGAAPGARASVRAALGAAGYAMSDEDVDRIIAAAQSSP